MYNVTFQGKREVMYGLRNAAACAKSAEYGRAASFGPRPVNRSQIEMTNKANMNAYLDMACYDNSFVNTIVNMTQKEIKELAEILKPQKVQYGEINPLEIFTESLTNICKTHKKGGAKPLIGELTKNL